MTMTLHGWVAFSGGRPGLERTDKPVPTPGPRAQGPGPSTLETPRGQPDAEDMRDQVATHARRTLHPPVLARHARAAWLVAWSGMVVVALANGTFRAAVTQPLLGETAARQVATVLLLAALFAYHWWLERRFPLPSRGAAVQVGVAWTLMTLAFELGFGRFVEHLTWSTMLADYDLSRGRIWVLVPLWLLIGPATVRRVQTRTARF